MRNMAWREQPSKEVENGKKGRDDIEALKLAMEREKEANQFY